MFGIVEVRTPASRSGSALSRRQRALSCWRRTMSAYQPPWATRSSWEPAAGDPAVAEDDDAVGAADGGEAVGDDEGGAAEGQAVEGFLDQGFGFGVDR